MVQESHDPAESDAKAPPRERILKAADSLFERYGIRGVGVEAIAEAAETNKMTLYRHFTSKDELVAAWLRMVVDAWMTEWDALEQIPASVEPLVRIDRFLDAFGSAFERCAVRGCKMMNSLAELPEKDHPARRVLDEYKTATRERMTRFFASVGITDPARAAEEVQLLMDGAKAGVQDWGAAHCGARFTEMSRALLEARLNRAN